jgi:hypothetical protein
MSVSVSDYKLLENTVAEQAKAITELHNRMAIIESKVSTLNTAIDSANDSKRAKKAAPAGDAAFADIVVDVASKTKTKKADNIDVFFRKNWATYSAEVLKIVELKNAFDDKAEEKEFARLRAVWNILSKSNNHKTLLKKIKDDRDADFAKKTVDGAEDAPLVEPAVKKRAPRKAKTDDSKSDAAVDPEAAGTPSKPAKAEPKKKAGAKAKVAPSHAVDMSELADC